MAEYSQGTFMWFGGYEVCWVSGDKTIVLFGSVIMIPGEDIVLNDSQTSKHSREKVMQIKILDTLPEENDILWQHPSFFMEEGVWYDKRV